MIPGIVASQGNASPVTLLMHMDGPNGSTTFTDSARPPKTFTANGNAQISTAHSMFGGASALFDGSVDYLSSPADAAYDFDTGDFTIECFVRLAAYSPAWGVGGYGACLVATYVGGSAAPRGWMMRVNGTSGSYNEVYVYTGFNELFFPASFALNTWYHVAVTRSAGQIRAFVDGVQVGSTTPNSDSFSGSVSASKPLFVGSLNFPGVELALNGYIDELRLTKGVAWYTANFTPPAAPFPDP